MATSTVTGKAKYIFNICHMAITSKDDQTLIWTQFPYSKPDLSSKQKLPLYEIKQKPNHPLIINAYCQLFYGPSKYHNDSPSYRLSKFDEVLKELTIRHPDITSIAFPSDLNDQQMLRVENFTKSYYSKHNLNVHVFDYDGKIMIDPNRKSVVHYYGNEELNLSNVATTASSSSSSISMTPAIVTLFPYRIVRSYDSLGDLLSSLKSGERKATKKEAGGEPLLPTSASPKKNIVVIKKKVRIIREKYLTFFKSLQETWPSIVNDETLAILKPINDHLVKMINEENANVVPYPFTDAFRPFQTMTEGQLKAIILGNEPTELDDILTSIQTKHHQIECCQSKGIMILPRSLTSLLGLVVTTAEKKEEDENKKTKGYFKVLWQPFLDLLLKQLQHAYPSLSILDWDDISPLDELPPCLKELLLIGD